AVLGRPPGAILPAAPAVQERQRGVDAIVALVPALLAREHRPRLDLAELRVETRCGRIEQARDAVLGRVAAPAAPARKRGVELAPAGGTTDVARQSHDRTIVTGRVRQDAFRNR